jgi:hypothetical protein
MLSTFETVWAVHIMRLVNSWKGYVWTRLQPPQGRPKRMAARGVADSNTPEAKIACSVKLGAVLPEVGRASSMKAARMG